MPLSFTTSAVVGVFLDGGALALLSQYCTVSGFRLLPTLHTDAASPEVPGGMANIRSQSYVAILLVLFACARVLLSPVLFERHRSKTPLRARHLFVGVAKLGTATAAGVVVFNAFVASGAAAYKAGGVAAGLPAPERWIVLALWSAASLLFGFGVEALRTSSTAERHLFPSSAAAAAAQPNLLESVRAQVAAQVDGLGEAMLLAPSRDAAAADEREVLDEVLGMFAEGGAPARLERLGDLAARAPRAIEASVPHLITYLLYYARGDRAPLRMWLLRRAAACPRFAHKLSWFVRAFQLSDRAAAAYLEMDGAGEKYDLDEPTQYLFDLLRDVEAAAAAEAERLREGPHRLPPRPDATADSPAIAAVPRFVQALERVACDLKAVPRKDRTAALRAELAVIDRLSSDSYCPVGANGNHRIWRLHPEESFAFSTKERVPILVCAEVVDYAPSPEPLRPYETQQRRQALAASRKPLMWVVDDGFDALRQTITSALGIRSPGTPVAAPSPRRARRRPPSTPMSLAPAEGDDMAAGRGETGDEGEDDMGQWAVAATGDDVDDAMRQCAADAVAVDFEKTGTEPLLSPSPQPPPLPGASEVSGPPADTTVVFAERWAAKEARLRAASAVGHLRGWRLVAFIVKADDDLRQEQLAAALLSAVHRVLVDGGGAPSAAADAAGDAHRARLRQTWMRTYDIVATTSTSGLIEAVTDTISLDALKKRTTQWVDLDTFFQRQFEGGPALEAARSAFVASLAPASMSCYLLQLKDRHNGNILLDAHGHVVHIDFGFMFLNSPGGNLNFERAPFKLTTDFVGVMGGPDSRLFRRFRALCVASFLELRKHRHRIVLLAEMAACGNEGLPCFCGQPDVALKELRDRFVPDLNDAACAEHVNGLVDQALASWSTGVYDSYQRCCTGIL